MVILCHIVARGSIISYIVDDAKHTAELIYPGSAACWVEAHFTVEDAERYLEKSFSGMRCSLCGKRPDAASSGTLQEKEMRGSAETACENSMMPFASGQYLRTELAERCYVAV